MGGQQGMNNMDNNSSPATNNPMLRNHLEGIQRQQQQQQQQSKLVQQLSSGGNVAPNRSSLLLSQLEKGPTSDPNPNVINKVSQAQK